MLRLLFTTKDLSKQMTVITDGVDSQMNVFVTENTVGDVDYYKSLGIVIKAGITYNIGKFIEWCLANELGLIGYPEGLEEEKINYVNVLDRTEYTFTLQTKTLSISSTKQKTVNGKNSGSPVAVNYTTTVSGTGFSKGTTEYSVVAAVNTGTAREGSAVVKQSEGTKQITITLSQAAGTSA